MTEINEKDLEKASGGTVYKVDWNDVCANFESRYSSDVSQTCSTCKHYHAVGGGIGHCLNKAE